ncbi:tRNA (cytosine(38)-C(5))-methyltransferase isoform X1 [Rhincodon typus]|uniref:tRNA (cytosine(38)-C(5))-methyltransferase isoform X1 n=2 Tax=Rhincodon typus TaxID=259920 RepID=UPI00202E9F49|nr:tRNA (cytosine(38)-C(5))-methyltransferase isoform X1 [Rhincodon typus]
MMEAAQAQLRVLELYSGIGGMHYALKESYTTAKVVAAVDINTIANEVYKHNFPNTYLCPKTIEGMTLDEFNKLDFDMILMSPPCQPFTRIGSQKDVLDPRTKSLLHILDILPRLSKAPKYILLENVKGFESSVARDKLIQALESCRYIYQEFLLSPILLGIPNSRLRYFLLAKLQPDAFCFQTSYQIIECFPDHEVADSRFTDGHSRFDQIVSTGDNKKEHNNSGYCAENDKSETTMTRLYKLETPEHLKKKQIQNNNLSIQMIQEFLEEELKDPRPYFIPPKTLLRYALILDIVGQSCRRSVCFTKGYGHYAEGTGSVLKTAPDVQLSEVFQSFQTLSEDEKLSRLSKLKLRYFTPREIANLHGFPPEFSFPETISLRQSYRLLGNSLNIKVHCTYTTREAAAVQDSVSPAPFQGQSRIHNKCWRSQQC